MAKYDWQDFWVTLWFFVPLFIGVAVFNALPMHSADDVGLTYFIDVAWGICPLSVLVFTVFKILRRSA